MRGIKKELLYLNKICYNKRAGKDNYSSPNNNLSLKTTTYRKSLLTWHSIGGAFIYCSWYNNNMKNKKISEIDNKIEIAKKNRKDKIKAEPNKFKRFWKWVWYYMTFTFVWIFQNLKDWRTMVIFVSVMAIISCEVWIPYLMGFITWGTDFSKWCFGIASTIWVWWLLPGTPFLPLCIFITIGIKALFNRIKTKRR